MGGCVVDDECGGMPVLSLERGPAQQQSSKTIVQTAYHDVLSTRQSVPHPAHLLQFDLSAQHVSRQAEHT